MGELSRPVVVYINCFVALSIGNKLSMDYYLSRSGEECLFMPMCRGQIYHLLDINIRARKYRR